MDSDSAPLLLALTTFASEADARRLAEGAIAKKLAACAHIEGPITAIYRWKGNVEGEAEWRVLFKFPPQLERSLNDWVHAQHPYETPAWVVWKASSVSEGYLTWAHESCRQD